MSIFILYKALGRLVQKKEMRKKPVKSASKKLAPSKLAALKLACLSMDCNKEQQKHNEVLYPN